MTKSLARRLEELESQLRPEKDDGPLVVQIVYFSPDGSTEDGERFIIANPGPRVPYGKRRR